MSPKQTVQTEAGLLRRQQARNFRLGVINGAALNMSDVWIDTDMALTWFLSQLGVPNWMIGLLGPIRNGSWFLPQLFVSGYMQRQPLKLPFYRLLTVGRSAALLLLLLTVTWLPGRQVIPAFFVLLTVYSLGSGFAGIPFMDVVAKVIPATRRGAFFSQRMFWGGILSMIASAGVGFFLSEPDGLKFPYNYTVLFSAALIAILISMGSWCLVREPPGETDIRSGGWIEQVWRGVDLLRLNRPYRAFVLTRLALMLAQLAGPFYLIYARQVLHIPAGMVGVYLTARTVAAILSNLAWGRISDRRGNRMLIRLSNLVGLIMPLTALGLGRLGATNPALLTGLAYIYPVVFIAGGAFGSGSAIGNTNYLLDIAPPAQRSLYLGFTNTLFGVGIFTSALGGLIVDWAGFDVLLLVSVLFYLVAGLLSLRLIEPRQAT